MRRLLLTLLVFLLICAPAHASWSWPVRGDVITPYRNGDNPYAGGQHRGIDIAAAVGTPVVAAAGGQVRFAGTAGSSGLTVSVRTGDGFDTSYLHLSTVTVRAGASISAGERIGAVGTTGTRSAVQAHLHFGVREAGTRHAYIDPLSMLPSIAPPPPAETPRPAPAPAPSPLRPSPAPAPRPAPAPSGAPRPAPAPRRLPRPAPRLAPRPAPAPRLAPRPAPAPRGTPRPAPLGAPRLAPAPDGAPGHAPAPRSSPAHSPRLARRTGPAPAPLGPPRSTPASLGARRLTPASLRAPRLAISPREAPRPGALGTQGAPAPSPLDASRSGSAQGRPAPPARRPGTGVDRAKASSGPDIGWALACAGLLLAAAILGLTGDGRDASKRTRARLARSPSRLAVALRPLFGRR